MELLSLLLLLSLSLLLFAVELSQIIALNIEADATWTVGLVGRVR